VKVEQHHDLIRLDGVPLRTPYTKIAAGLINLLKQLYNKQRQELQASPPNYEVPGEDPDCVTVGLAIDEGGVGNAIRDILIKEAEERLAYGEPHIHFLPAPYTAGPIRPALKASGTSLKGTL
jgi:hypothetical protein